MKRKSEEGKPIEPDQIIDPPSLPMRTVQLRLDRTKKYAQEILAMPAAEAMKLINEQAQLKLLLMGEQILKWIEILDGEVDYKRRLEASAHIQTMTNCIAMIAKARLDVMKAAGADMAALLPANGEPVENAIQEVTADEFMKRYADESRKLIPDNIPENTPKQV